MAGLTARAAPCLRVKIYGWSRQLAALKPPTIRKLTTAISLTLFYRLMNKAPPCVACDFYHHSYFMERTALGQKLLLNTLKSFTSV